MRLNKVDLRGYLRVALALSLVTLFSLASMASAPLTAPTEHPIVPQGPTGMLNVRGTVTINGNPAAAGATIMSGTIIATGPDGVATIELGPLGRIELQPNTAITAVSLSPSSETLTLDRSGWVTVTFGSGVAGRLTDTNHSQVRIRVISGRVHVKSTGREQNLAAGQSGAFDNLEEVASSGGCTFVVQSVQSLPASPGGAGGAGQAGGGGGGGGSVFKKKAVWIPLGLAGLGGIAYGIDRAVSGNEAAAVSPSVP